MLEIFAGKVIKQVDSYFVTDGLSNELKFELKIKVGNFDSKDYIYVIKYIIDYISKENPTILKNQTISFNSWILKFIESEDGFFEIYELDKNLKDFVKGADYSIEILNSQILVCQNFNSNFNFPSFNQNVVISDGVLEDYMIEAVRYKSPKHMSGWWLTTKLYNGDTKTLKQLPIYELITKTPHLIQYLALDYGFRFYLTKNEHDVWFDETIIK